MHFDIVIIGGGPAGYTAAETAAKAGLKVVLFDQQQLGGVCLNEGCIPTKTLLYSAKTYDSAKQAAKYAVNIEGATYDLPKIIARKNKIVRKLVLGIKNKLTELEVPLLKGHVEIIGPHIVRCDEYTFVCRNILLCTGSETVIPPLPGLDTVSYWTHREALDNKEVPASLLIIGGGVIGMEFASFFNSLGTKVTVIEMMDEVLSGMDKEIAALLRAEYIKKGVNILTGTRVTGVANTDAGITATFENAEGTGTVTTERLLLSVGRRPALKGYGLELLIREGVCINDRGGIKVNEHMQTAIENVYASGDVTGYSMLAHTAVREAEVAVHHILKKKDRMSYNAIPGVVYTQPEVAGVGETEESLKDKGISYRIVKLPMAFSGRFVAENEGVNGLCKLLISPDNVILGAHVIGNPASEIITLATMAIDLKLTTEQWKKIVFPHPTVGEIFREAL